MKVGMNKGNMVLQPAIRQGSSYTRGSQRVVPGLAATASPGNQLEMQLIGPHPRRTEPQTRDEA